MYFVCYYYIATDYFCEKVYLFEEMFYPSKYT
jgi:hypothetical protein